MIKFTSLDDDSASNSSDFTLMLFSIKNEDIRLHSLFTLHKIVISLKLNPCFCFQEINFKTLS